MGLTEPYNEAPTRHEMHVNDRVRYAYCVPGALQVAAMEDQATVTVRSLDPLSDV